MLVSPDSGTKSNICFDFIIHAGISVVCWMYFTAFLNGISLLIYWHYAWPVWPGNAPWQTDTPPPIIRCQTRGPAQLTGASVLRQVPGPGVSLLTPHSSRCRPERHSVLSWLSPGSHLRHPSHSCPHTDTRPRVQAQSEESSNLVLQSFAINKNTLIEGQFNKSVVCDKLDVPDCDWIDHISR